MKLQLYCFTTLTIIVTIKASPYPKYKGCFKDGDPRDLPQKVFSRGGSVRGCVKKCHALGFMNAGVQFSYLCFCGNTSGRYGRLPDSACNSRCRKKRDKICGGEWANAVYDTGYRDEKYKPKKRKPVKIESSNSTSSDAGSGSAAHEIVTSGSSADGVNAQETSAQEPPTEELKQQSKGPKATNASPMSLIGSAAQMIASLGREPAVSGPAVPQQAASARGAIPQASVPQVSASQGTPNSQAPSELTTEQMLSAL